MSEKAMPKIWISSMHLEFPLILGQFLASSYDQSVTKINTKPVLNERKLDTKPRFDNDLA